MQLFKAIFHVALLIIVLLEEGSLPLCVCVCVCLGYRCRVLVSVSSNLLHGHRLVVRRFRHLAGYCAVSAVTGGRQIWR